MSFDPVAVRLEAARSVVRDAAALALSMRPAPGGPTGTLKGRQDYLTEADGAVEALISARIQELFPDDGFQGEENGTTRQGRFRWVVDPIDGTSNFARGRDRWCVSLGLLDGDTPVAGIIDAPALQEVFTARKGHGAFLNGKRIKASPIANPQEAMVEMGWSARVPKGIFEEKIAAIMAMGAMPRSGGSGALALTDVACGRSDGYLEIVIQLWDVAAALIILDEAGAAVSPFLQSGGLTGGATILAAAPALAPILSQAFGVEI
ncbi:inositol monophosphatase family protein [Gluconobacter morbifer]|uniref:Myo-inositol-1(Or 4)-monophosphatase n=1 Tax=Gluconobacter morbifer G707 TaxID=1088869 RepID=G6XGY8_9PROT|nr:inositol monophosphatase family protein [Gluconobacter morbifer]EHH69446.1 myo-inositol-1(or 4)-monophosphatase [Gluconobacter morbifer G707]